MIKAPIDQPRSILALVTDLFFRLKIDDTAKSLGWPIQFAGGATEFLDSLQKTRPGLVIVDLMLDGVDVSALFSHLMVQPNQVSVPVLGYTTHADWKRTQPLHEKCTKVVTKDTLSRCLPELMQLLVQQG